MAVPIGSRIPGHWQAYKIHYRYRETVYHIVFKRVGETPRCALSLFLEGMQHVTAFFRAQMDSGF